jgi:hypothetical protein
MKERRRQGFAMNRFYSVSVAVVGLSLLSIPGGAEVLCKSKKGVLAARSGCKGKETQVDPAALGLVGPKGDKGDKGDTGPAGPGARWALVKYDGTIATQSGRISVTTDSNAAIYYVNFGSSQANKAILVSATCPSGVCFSSRGAVVAALCGGSAAGTTCSAPGTNDDSHVQVSTTDPAGGAPLLDDFFIAVF